MNNIGTREDVEKANAIRKYFANLAGISSSEQMVLFFGIGASLRLFFSTLPVRHVVMGPEEYLSDCISFSYASTTEVGMAEIVETVRKEKPDAVILSLVSYLGNVFPVAKIFGEIRKRCGQSCPLLVADCAHAGAINFPNMKGLGADVICLDTGKWVLPNTWKLWAGSLALLWFSPDYYKMAERTFFPFALALSHTKRGRPIEWVMDPDKVHRIASMLPNRLVLRRRLQRNMMMAQRLGKQLELRNVESSLITLDEKDAPAKVISELKKRGLVWQLPNGNIRIKCLSDVY